MLLVNGQRKPGEELPTLKTKYVFELTEAYSNYDEKNKRTTKANVFMMTPSYTYYDKKTNDNVEMRYAETEVPYQGGDGKMGKKYSPNRVLFIKGLRVVNTDQPDLYEWLINHPGFEGENKKGPFKFRLISAEKKASKSVFDKTAKFEAMALIMGEKALKEPALRRILISFGEGGVDDMTPDQVKDSLLKRAESTPHDFIKACMSNDIDIKVLIHDARQQNKLDFVQKTNKWVWGTKAGASAETEIIAVPQGRKAVDWFIEWLMRGDNTGVLNELQIAVNGIAKTEKNKTGQPQEA